MPKPQVKQESSKAEGKDQQNSQSNRKPYLRFGAMIATSMLVMYGVMYMNTYQLSHVEWSETRLFMTLLMGATMSVVMLLYMLGMFKDKKVNAGIIVGSVLVFVVGTWLVRSQDTVDDQSYMSAMIPHHSIAILTSENSQIEDVRVCELAVKIIKAQRREIDEMQWLIADIKENGAAETKAEAEHRKVPSFDGVAIRNCPVQ